MTEINPQQLPILLYDSECTLCRRFKDALERIDSNKKIQFVSIHEKEIYQYFAELDIKECADVIHLIDEDKKIHRGAQVIEYLVSFFPAVSKFAWLIDSGMGKKALEFFYDRVNDLRKSELNSCQACHKKKHD